MATTIRTVKPDGTGDHLTLAAWATAIAASSDNEYAVCFPGDIGGATLGSGLLCPQIRIYAGQEHDGRGGSTTGKTYTTSPIIVNRREVMIKGIYFDQCQSGIVANMVTMPNPALEINYLAIEKCVFYNCLNPLYINRTQFQNIILDNNDPSFVRVCHNAFYFDNFSDFAIKLYVDGSPTNYEIYLQSWLTNNSILSNSGLQAGIILQNTWDSADKGTELDCILLNNVVMGASGLGNASNWHAFVINENAYHPDQGPTSQHVGLYANATDDTSMVARDNTPGSGTSFPNQNIWNWCKDPKKDGRLPSSVSPGKLGGYNVNVLSNSDIYTYATTEDITGASRPSGNRWDMGAFNYVPTAPFVINNDAGTDELNRAAIMGDTVANPSKFPNTSNKKLADVGTLPSGIVSNTGEAQRVITSRVSFGSVDRGIDTFSISYNGMSQTIEEYP